MCSDCERTMQYPAVKIPTKPVGTIFKSEIGKPLLRWEWSDQIYCVPCAKKRIKSLTEEEITP